MLLWQDELNPRVRCAFGNVSYETDTGVRSGSSFSRFSRFAFLHPEIFSSTQVHPEVQECRWQGNGEEVSDQHCRLGWEV